MYIIIDIYIYICVCYCKTNYALVAQDFHGFACKYLPSPEVLLRHIGRLKHPEPKMVPQSSSRSLLFMESAHFISLLMSNTANLGCQTTCSRYSFSAFLISQTQFHHHFQCIEGLQKKNLVKHGAEPQQTFTSSSVDLGSLAIVVSPQ